MMSPVESTTAGSDRPKAVLLYWGRRGGGSEFTRFLGEFLSRSDEIEVVFSLAQQNEEMADFAATGLPRLTIDRPDLANLWRKGWRLPARLKAHADEIAAERPSIVIITMNAPFAWPFIHHLQRRGLRVGYVAHDAEPHPGDYARLWQRMTQDLLIERADKVVALSSVVSSRIAERIPSAASKLSQIPLEVVFPTKRETMRPRAAHEPLRLLFFGRLLPYKGLELLAQVLRPLRSSGGWHLTIAGAGPLEPEIRELFGGWPEATLELGWISNARTDALYASHDLLLCPYNEASQSGVVSQALCWALPTLVMPTGALPEQIGDGEAGLVAQAVDVTSFSTGLLSLLHEPARLQELSKGASALLRRRQFDRRWLDIAKMTHRDHPQGNGKNRCQ